MAEQYYVQVNGKAMGPFSLEQLEALRDRGRLQKDSRVSSDRRKWAPASSVSQLFPSTSHRTQDEPVGSGQRDQSASQPESPKWYYSQGNEELGPVTWATLNHMVESGRLSPSDMVWTEELGEWKTVKSVDGLMPEMKGTSNRRLKESAAFQNYQRAASSRFWDGLLQIVRNQITAQDLENACRTLLTLGNYAVMVAMLAGPAFILIQGIKLDSIRLGLMSVVLFLGLAVLKYVAQRMSIAAHEVISASQSRLSSSAFCDSIALSLLFTAVACFSLFTFWGIQQDDIFETIGYIVIGVQILITAGYAGCTALHPSWLNVDCSTPVRAGEEGLGVMAVVLKVSLRFAPINFGVGAIFGSLGLVAGLILLMVGGKWLPMAFTIGSFSIGWLVAVCLIPTAAYLLMVLFSIGLDLVQSVLIIPEKLENLSGHEKSAED